MAWRRRVVLGSEVEGDGGGTAAVVVLGGAGRGWWGGFCRQQVAVQCVVRVAAKHWASGLQETVEGRGKEEDQ